MAMSSFVRSGLVLTSQVVQDEVADSHSTRRAGGLHECVLVLEQGDLRAALRMLEPSLTLLRASGFGAPNILSAGSINAMGLGHAVGLSRWAEAYLRAGRRADEAVARGRQRAPAGRYLKFL
jgi:hypothetical protein